MRWITRFIGAVLLVALAAQPAAAVDVDMPILGQQGDPVVGFTFAFNWPNGKVTVMTTDAYGRLKGDVPEGWHRCSVWLEALHLESGNCNLTEDMSQFFSEEEIIQFYSSSETPLATAPHVAANLPVDTYIYNPQVRNWYPPQRPRIVLASKPVPFEGKAIRRKVSIKMLRKTIVYSWGYASGDTKKGAMGGMLFGHMMSDLFGIIEENAGAGD
jgi:hypothetical protein